MRAVTVILAVALAVIGVVEAPQSAQGRLECAAWERDFGAAFAGETLAHTFELASAGDAPLAISRVDTTCGCAVARVEVAAGDGSWARYRLGDPIAPGTAIRVHAELDTTTKDGPTAVAVKVVCNDPRGVVPLALRAHVSSYFDVRPSALPFGLLSATTHVERTVEIRGRRPGAFALSLDRAPLPDGARVELAAVEPDPDGKASRWDVRVSIGPGCREGALSFAVTLRGGAEHPYCARFMVSGRIHGPVWSDPEYLSFGMVRPGVAAERKVVVMAEDPSFTFPAEPKARIAGPSDAAPDFPHASSFSLSVARGDGGKFLELTLKLEGLPATADGSFLGRLMLETGHPQRPVLAVPFSGTCRR